MNPVKKINIIYKCTVNYYKLLQGFYYILTLTIMPKNIYIIRVSLTVNVYLITIRFVSGQNICIKELESREVGDRETRLLL